MSEAIIGTITGIVGAFFGAFGKWLLDWKKDRHKDDLDKDGQEHHQKLDNNDQAFTLYKSLVESLTKELESIKTKTEALEDNYIKTKVENASLLTENKFLRERISELVKKT